MSTTPEGFDDLSPEQKRARLKLLLEQKARQPKTAVPSFAQERLWVLEQLTPGTPVYTEAGAVRIKADLEVGMLEQMINEVVQRHEALRTTFGVDNGKPVQRIAPTLRIPVQLEDLRNLPEQEREAEAMRRATAQSRIPFDLSRGPLLRVNLLRLNDADQVLVMTLHHIIADGWSIGVLVQELMTLFLARASGRAAAIPKLPIQYADFARWQREWLEGEISERQLAFWKEQLRGVEVLELPTDRPRPAVRSFQGATLQLGFDEKLTEDLRALARSEGATLFMTMLSAFQTLLHRYTGGRIDDLVVGAPVAGRGRRELESLIGFFVNMVPIRTEIGGDPTFRELLRRVQGACLDAYHNEDVPFERLVDELQIERSLSHPPLFQVVFALHRNVMEIEDVNGFSFQPLDVENGTSKYDLTLFLWEGTKALTGHLEYNTDLFDTGTIERMAQHLDMLLRSIVRDPAQRLSRLSLLSPEEQRRLVAGDAPDAVFPSGPALHRRFEEHVDRTPDAVAVVCGETRLTYAELESRANRLAHHLRRHGVGPDVAVALYLERSLDLVVAILAVMKAGGAYVPIAPEYPCERVRYMLLDTETPVVLVSESLLEAMGEQQTRAICLEHAAGEIAEESDARPAVETAPENLAYVIYTSGSTGTPKGVPVTHANVVRLFEATDDWFRFGPEDVWTLFHSYAFDFSVWELWGALIYGGRLVVVPYLVSRSPEEFCALVRREGVTVLNQTPSAFRQFIRADAEASRPDGLALRLVIFGGEALDFAILKPWFDRHPEDHPRLVNMYGITETTVHVTYRPIAAAEARAAAGSSIGRPLPDLKLYILDRDLNPVPLGVPGEIHVGGSGLARGYLGRPDLTAERFVPDPYGSRPGARLYKSGDLARRRGDGEIDYLGRIDHQVKVRGFRIELGEIEAALQDHPAVRQAVVVVREDGPGDKRLVGYIVSTEPPSVGDLRAVLRNRLPDYMVPTAFVVLDALPLTSNGKLDRKALPVPEADRPELDQVYVAPRSDREGRLAQIWAEVLGIERVGVRDNFFELGGDSILAIQVVSRAGAAGIRISAKHLFQYQTIAELAVVAETGQAIEAEQGPVTGEIGLTPIQRWLFERQLTSLHHYNQSLMLELREKLDADHLGRATSELVRHHDALRLRYTASENGWIQTTADAEGHALLQCVDLSALGPERLCEALERAGAEQQSSLDLEHGPLFRVVLFTTAAGQPDRLLLLAHHLVIDGVSWRILLEDLLTAYAQLERGTAIQLPAKTTSFRYWSERLARHVSEGGVDAERTWWLDVTGRRPTPLPLDCATGPNDVGSSETLELGLTAQETQSLLQEVPTAYRTRINDVLLTALVETLGAWTGDCSALVDLEGHGREDLFEEVDLSRTLGWFTSLYPVQLSLEQGQSVGTALKSVKEQLRSVPGNGLGYGLLRYLSPDEELARSLVSRAEVSFNYLGQFGATFPGRAPFRLASDSAGPLHAPSTERSHVLEINGAVHEGRLRLAWTYSRNLHERSSIERLAERYMKVLRELIEHCLSAEAGGCTPSDFPLAGLDAPALDRLVGRDRGVEDLYPLSPAQSGILFHSLYAPDSAVYCGQMSCLLEGDIEVGAFRKAWHDAVDRHQVLRTRFVWEGLGEPLQVVQRQTVLPWIELDWRDLTADEKDARLEAFLEDERSTGFDLSQAPLMRLSLIRLDDDAYRFVWSHHHLLLDGWSLAALLRDVMLAYEACVRGIDMPVDPVRPYRDYIEWLRSREAAEKEGDEAFWRAELQGLTHPTPAVVDRPLRTDLRASQAFADVEAALPERLSGKLEQLARSHQLTLNTIVQGAWALLLSRYSGEPDVTFGTMFSGRSGPVVGVESMVGVFINSLAIRVRVDPAEPLLSWLEKQQQHQARVAQYETTPLVKVQGWSDLQRGVPLFESLFIFENYPIDGSLQRAGGSLRVRDASLRGRPHYPLTVLAAPGPPVLLRIAFDRRRFDEASVEAMLAHLRVLLQAMVADPERPLRDLPLLGVEERKHLVADCNASEKEYATDACVHEMFERQVERTPDAPAVASEVEQLSYSELNGRANRLARHLKGLGVNHDAAVAICMPRSAESIVSLLAVLKAGGAYVPIDAGQPSQRIGRVLADCGARVVLAHSAVESKLAELDLQTVLVDRVFTDLIESPDHNLRGIADDRSAAYVIYTSGSTGRPKGVVVEHRQIRNYILGFVDRLGIRADASYAMVQPLSVDSSQSSIFPALIGGGTIHVISEETALEPEALSRYFERHVIDCLKIAPSHLAAMQTGGPARMLPRGWLIVGGEASRSDWARTLPALAPGCKMFNHYGPTEATVGMLTWPLGDGSGLGDTTTVPIGTPLPNSRAYLLDSELEPVPVGVPGELYIGGEGVARGYLGRPELTAAAFVPDPFGSDPGGRLYASGDLCRRLPSGAIEFIGRRDHQVKIRGFRIELAEIESALAEHDALRDCAVLARDDKSGGARLVAYYVPQDPDSAPGPEQIRGFLRERLPDPMIPTAYVSLDELPRTAHGKMDVRALPLPEGLRPDEVEYVAPRTEQERKLAAIWTELLGVDRVGVHDDFFGLGGHSLLATQLMSRMREAFRVDLPLRELFDASTVAGQAEVIQRARRTDEAPPIEAAPRSGQLSLSYAQESLWFLEQLTPGDVSYNMPGAVRIHGALDVDALQRSFAEIVRRHESLRTVFAEVDGQPNQTIVSSQPVHVAQVDLRSLDADARETEVHRRAREEALRAFRLDRGPLLRLTLLQLDEEQHVLLATLHHIVSDGWSIGVMMREFVMLYEVLRKGQPSPLGELSFQYVDYAHWQRGWLHGERLERQLAFWKEQLASVTKLELPTDRPRPRLRSNRGGLYTFRLDASLRDGVHALSQLEKATSFMTLLVAFQIMLRHRTGQDDIAVGTDVANRNRVGTEGLIGFFVNQLVLRQRLDGRLSFRELLRRVRETALEAYDHQDVPFEKVVAALNPRRDLSRTPLFDVKLVLQNVPMPTVDLGGLRLELVELDFEVTKFDLLLNLRESSDGFEGHLTYSTDLFDQETVAQMVQEFETVIRLAITAPDARIEALQESLAEHGHRKRVERARRRKRANVERLRRIRRGPSNAPRATGGNRP